MTRVKICGLSREADMVIVNHYLPDYAGFVFAESRRQVTLEVAKKLISMMDKSIIPVGVFVDASMDEVVKTVQFCGLRAVQLHGNEDESYASALKIKLPEMMIMKAVRMKDENSAVQANVFPCDLLLLDTYAKGEQGGTGQTFDWELAKQVTKPYLLAGGLSIDNVENAMALLCPYGVDVSSGVETNGFKDVLKIDGWMNTVRRRNP